ncbi:MULTISPECIES: YjiH family protein [Ureibacillus]|uniref:Nucleoside recognition membrane protein YjiH n=1 Tax=Ureibacillus thermosphaericus TaxID=51173 RepID=A0A840Q4M0_URETH|nr:YjiH family protein [Ureibacillus thermosphaericus]MBB5149946.1 nucleoside recognition membrane protein YjiH [Ureibacillus thermosphaericus]NKZ32618.1 YjiH family protein [Ureibacillus thermosphaericus]
MVKKFHPYTWFLFLCLSILGIFLFIIPVSTPDGLKVPIALLANGLSANIVTFIHWFAYVVFIIAAVGSIVMHFVPQSGKVTIFDALFRTHAFWTVMRVLAVVFATLYLFQIGPEAFTSENTSGLLLNPDGGLVTMMFSLFFFAGLLLPLLTDFGLLEFFGSMMVKIMRPIFKIPGRAAIDCLASWVGDGTIGVLLTSRQYEQGNYTAREAATIATTFSVVSITFCFVIVETVDLGHYFLQFYGTVILVGLILAVIMPRIYPLRNKPDTNFDGSTPESRREDVPEGFNSFTFGLQNALDKAHSNRNLLNVVRSGFKNVLEMWFAITPVIMAFGTIALILAEYTSFFKILGMPFEPILQLFQIPYADEAAQTMIIGFADMLLPSILGAGIESELTRFFIATISVTQLIYMSEVGGLILGTKLPLKIWDLFIIFLIRTIISIPIVAFIAHLIF